MVNISKVIGKVTRAGLSMNTAGIMIGTGIIEAEIIVTMITTTTGTS
jgi:hypothetical protein